MGKSNLIKDKYLKLQNDDTDCHNNKVVLNLITTF